MASLIHKLLPSSNGQTLYHSLVDRYDVDTAVSENISEALANNDIELFEVLAQDIMTRTNYNPQVQNLLKIQMQKMSNGSKLIDAVELLFSGSTKSNLLELFIALIPVTMHFHVDVPFPVTVFTFLIFAGCFGLSLCVNAFAQQVNAASDRLFGASFKKAQRNEMIQLHGSCGEVAEHLMSRASCGTHVSREVIQKTMSLHAISVMYGVTDACSKTVAALQGRIDQGDDFGGMAGEKIKLESHNSVKSEVEELKKSINEIHEAVDQRTNAVARTAEYADDWAAEVKSLQRAIESFLKRWPARPDRLLLPDERRTKQAIFDKISERINELVAQFKKDRKACQCDRDFDCKDINDRSSKLVRALAYSPHLDQAQQKCIMDAIKSRSLLEEELAKKVEARTKMELEIGDCKLRLENASCVMYNRLRQVQLKKETQREHNIHLGQGSVNMWGKAPKDDKVAVQLEEYWQNGEFDKLSNYEVKGPWGTIFKVKRSPQLTPEQKKGFALMEKYLKEEDDIKAEFWNEVKRHHDKKTILEGQIGNLRNAEDVARKEVEDSRSISDDSWNTFKMKCPVAFSQIELLYNVNEYVGTVAKWTFHMNTNLHPIAGLMRRLEEELEIEPFHPKNVLRVVEEMLENLESQDTSSVALFRNIGGRDLRKLMRPCGAPSAEGVAKSLQQFDEDSRKALEADSMSVVSVD